MYNLKPYTKIKELFDIEFFIEFGKFIFDGDYETFKNNCFQRKEQFSNKINIKELINQDYSSLNITCFKDFVICFSSNKVFQYCIEMDVLQIKYLLNNYFSNREFSSENISIKLSDKIIKDFYKYETDKLLNAELQNLHNDYYDNNNFIKFKDINDIQDFKAKIILFILNYTLNYAKEIILNIIPDNQNLMDVYKLDTRYKLNCEIWDENNQLSKELNEKRKQLKCAKYNKNIGRKIKNHGKINPINMEELKQHIEIAKGIINKHKAKIKNICKLEKFKAKSTFETYIENLDYETKILLKIYFEENYGLHNSASVEYCVYKAMDDKFALDFFSEENINGDTCAYNAMKKYIIRYEQEGHPYKNNLFSSDFENTILNLSIKAFGNDLAQHIYNQFLGQN